MRCGRRIKTFRMTPPVIDYSLARVTLDYNAIPERARKSNVKKIKEFFDLENDENNCINLIAIYLSSKVKKEREREREERDMV